MRSSLLLFLGLALLHTGVTALQCFNGSHRLTHPLEYAKIMPKLITCREGYDCCRKSSVNELRETYSCSNKCGDLGKKKDVKTKERDPLNVWMTHTVHTCSEATGPCGYQPPAFIADAKKRVSTGSKKCFVGAIKMDHLKKWKVELGPLPKLTACPVDTKCCRKIFYNGYDQFECSIDCGALGEKESLLTDIEVPFPPFDFHFKANLCREAIGPCLFDKDHYRD